MKKRILAAILLILFSCGILTFWGGGHFTGEPEYLFRHNVADRGHWVYWQDAYAVYGEDRNFSRQQERLLADGLIPQMPEYPTFTCGADYQPSGELAAMFFDWNNFPGIHGGQYKWLSVRILADRTQDTAAWAGSFIPAWYQSTITDIDGITVRGSGTPGMKDFGAGETYWNALVFEKNGLRYQIICNTDDTMDGMMKLLDFYIHKELDLDELSMEKGDTLTSEPLSENPDAFPGCIPDVDETAFVIDWDTYYHLRNGEPEWLWLRLDRGTLNDVYWEINPMTSEIEPDGRIGDLDREALMEASKNPESNRRELCLQQGPWCIEISWLEDEFSEDEIWTLIESLPVME